MRTMRTAMRERNLCSHGRAQSVTIIWSRHFGVPCCLVTWPVLNKMAAIHALSAYGDSDSDENESVEEEITPDHTAHLNSDVSISKLQSKIQLKSAPEVTAKVDRSSSRLAYIER